MRERDIAGIIMLYVVVFIVITAAIVLCYVNRKDNKLAQWRQPSIRWGEREHSWYAAVAIDASHVPAPVVAAFVVWLQEEGNMVLKLGDCIVTLTIGSEEEGILYSIVSKLSLKLLMSFLEFSSITIIPLITSIWYWYQTYPPLT